MELLLQNGADVDAKNQDGKTVLHLLALNGISEGVEMLLKYGARKDIKDGKGRTPLQIAEYYNEAVVALLR